MWLRTAAPDVLRYNSSGNNTLELGQASYHNAGEDTFSWPDDVIADASGDIWVVDDNRVTRHDSAGNFEMSFPAMDNQPWECRNDNQGFCNPASLAFDDGGFLYVADAENYRVQVFTISGGTPVYSTTIGETGVQGNDNSHFGYPANIATYGTGTVFVSDADNGRVQKCTYGPPWSCTTFYDVLDYPWGITVDSSGNVFIVDNGDWLVKQCNQYGTLCPVVVDEEDGLVDPNDVAVDALGNLYISEWYNTFRVSKYSGGSLSTFVGTIGAPFVPDTAHIYSPFGIAVDDSGNLYVGESYGFRWLKYNSAGNQLLAKGQAGISLNDANHFGDNLMGSPAFNASNLLYVPAGNRHCVRVYDQNFAYQNITLGTCGANGDDGTHFRAVGGVAISPLDGKIYVVDRNNHKVKIFSSANTYLNTLGAGNPTGQGNGNYQFDNPSDVAVDRNGTIYVADRNNQRVQVYNNSGAYLRSIGYIDDCDWQYDHLCGPHGVGVDALNRVYIADTWNNRVQVFDSNGAYLTTLSGSWGSGSSDMISPADVTIDKNYNVYVTDMDNHRISKFTLGVIDWQQSNLNGFADPGKQWMWGLEPFKDYLYASSEGSTDWGELWRMSDSTGWSQVSSFGKANQWLIADMTEFNNRLYASTYEDAGAGIWRSDDGLTWSQVYTGNVATDYNQGIWNMVVYSNTIYAVTEVTGSSPHGAQILKSSTGDSSSWTPAAPDGFGEPLNVFGSFQVYDSCLYIATENYNIALGKDYGAQMHRTCDGSSWDRVDNLSFGDTSNAFVSAMEVFSNTLYISTGYSGSSTGAQLYRCQLCDGTDWEHVADDWLGNPHTDGRAVMINSNGWLYWMIYNGYKEGTVVWRTKNGSSWQQVGFAGFGDGNNLGPAGDQSAAIFKNRLFFGSRNTANGGEIWMFLPERVYLPLIRR